MAKRVWQAWILWEFASGKQCLVYRRLHSAAVGKDSLLQPQMCLSSPCPVKEPLETPLGQPEVFHPCCQNTELFQSEFNATVYNLFFYFHVSISCEIVNSLLTSFSCNKTLKAKQMVLLKYRKLISVKRRILFAFSS